MRVGLGGVMLAAAAMATATLACSKSPERVCDHLVEMARKQFGDLEDEKMRDQAQKTCVDDQRALKASDPKKYECFADCVVDVRLLAEASDCETKCGIAPKKTIEDEEPTDGIPGLWVDPYADATNEATSDAASEAASEAVAADAAKKTTNDGTSE